eukprot:372114_1
MSRSIFTNEDTIRVAWGSYGISGTNCTEDVIQALKVGYRHLDMASYYRNEKDIALGINRYGIPREKLYLVTKLSPFDMKTEEEVYKACVNSLKNLGIDYLDIIDQPAALSPPLHQAPRDFASSRRKH